MNALSESEIQTIQTFLDEQLLSESRVKAGDVWVTISNTSSFKDEVKFKNALSQAIKDNKFPGLKISRGRYGGIRRIKNGSNGIKISEKPKDSVRLFKTVIKNHPKAVADGLAAAKSASEAVEAEKPAAPAAPAEPIAAAGSSPDMDRVIPLPVRKNDRSKWFDLHLDEKHYVHTMNHYQVRDFMKYVIKVKESVDGNVKAFNKFYACSEEQSRILDALLFYCFGAKIIVTSSKKEVK